MFKSVQYSLLKDSLRSCFYFFILKKLDFSEHRLSSDPQEALHHHSSLHSESVSVRNDLQKFCSCQFVVFIPWTTASQVFCEWRECE